MEIRGGKGGGVSLDRGRAPAAGGYPARGRPGEGDNPATAVGRQRRLVAGPPCGGERGVTPGRDRKSVV